jgi:hypothetical protein
MSMLPGLLNLTKPQLLERLCAVLCAEFSGSQALAGSLNVKFVVGTGLVCMYVGVINVVV